MAPLSSGFSFGKWMVISLFGILLQSIGLVLFVMGFFPVKPALQGISGMESLDTYCAENSQFVATTERFSRVDFLEKLKVEPQFNRVVFMVVDGLPAEFLLGKGGLPATKEHAASMPYVQNLLSSRKAIGFHAKAAPPTVTMPRLKAMTSGAIAGYLDVAFNFNTQAMLDDNLIGQLGHIGWKMVMYGDETWLRLFPSVFVRQDGVSSFYVKDTIQVDLNVTRHLEEELMRSDWDLLILHYLGLDHVGHLGGRTSPLMAPKLREMDDVIRQLHLSLIKNKSGSVADSETLLMMVSDHGMTHDGNHGGASFEETDALALFIRETPFLEADYNEAFQVDLVPTLALLLGVPIPENNVGMVLIQLFDRLNEAEKLRALEVNAWQIMKLLKVRSKSTCLRSICSGEGLDIDSQSRDSSEQIFEICNMFKAAKHLHDNWRVLKNNGSCAFTDAEAVSLAYLSFLRAASGWLAKGTTEKNTGFVYSGGFLILLCTVLFWTVAASVDTQACNASKSKQELRISKPENWIAIAGVCGHACSFSSSSFVEEEQFTLHFLVVTLWCAFLWKACKKRWFYQLAACQDTKRLCNLLPSSRKSTVGNSCDGCAGDCDHGMVPTQAIAIVLVLITARLLRSWHRGGVNWAHLPDMAMWLEKGEPRTLLGTQMVSLALVTIICCWLVLEQRPHILLQRIVAGILVLVAGLIVWYNLRTSGVTLGLVDRLSINIAQLVYALLGGTALMAFLFIPFFCSPAWIEQLDTTRFHKGEYAGDHLILLNFIGKVLISCWCLLQFLLQQPVNSVPVLLLLLQLLSCLAFFNMSSSMLDAWLKALTLYWMGASGHFGMGNTNTLATVDVAGAYIGLSQHSIVWSGFLAFVITYAAPLLYMLAVLVMISLNGSNPKALDFKKVNQKWLLEAIALPCSIPLALSSVVLSVFTLVMLIMQGHLFIWSVFSPKYIYVCFTILSTYWGVILNALVTLYVVMSCKFLR